MFRTDYPALPAQPRPRVLTVRTGRVHVKLALEALPGVVQRARIGEDDVHVELEAPQGRVRGGRMERDAEWGGMEGDQHVWASGDDAGQPVAAAVLGEDGVVGGAPVVEDEVVALAGAVAPSPEGAGGLVEACDADGALHVHLVGCFLADSYHGVLARWYHLGVETQINCH